MLWQINTGASLSCMKYSFIILNDRSPPVICVLYNSTNKIILNYFHRQKFKIAAKVFVCVFRPGGKSVRRAGSLLHTSSFWAQTAANLHLHLQLVRNRTAFSGLMFFCVNLSSSLSMCFLPLVGQVIAIYDYTAANEDELSFSKSQVINVLDKSNPDWWKGELNGVTGLIPANYVKMTTSDSDPSQQCK